MKTVFSHLPQGRCARILINKAKFFNTGIIIVPFKIKNNMNTFIFISTIISNWKRHLPSSLNLTPLPQKRALQNNYVNGFRRAKLTQRQTILSNRESNIIGERNSVDETRKIGVKTL